MTEKKAVSSREKKKQVLDKGQLTVCDYQVAIDCVGGDLVLLSQVLAIFIDEIPKMSAAIKEYSLNKNDKGLRNEAHKMKGAASHFGGAELVHTLEQIEVLAMQQQFSEVLQFCEELEQTAKRFESCVKGWSNQSGVSVIV